VIVDFARRGGLVPGPVCVELPRFLECQGIEVQCRELATPSRELHDMAKKRKAAKRAGTSRPARRRRQRHSNPDATVNTLVILVVIVLVLGGLFLYAQNKKQAALFPGLTQTIAAITAPILRALPAGFGTSDITGSVRAPQPAAGPKAPAAGTETPPGPASAVDAPQPATVAVARTPQDD
jgi:hypothetical protein